MVMPERWRGRGREVGMRWSFSTGVTLCVLTVSPCAAMESALWKVRWEQGGQSEGCPREGVGRSREVMRSGEMLDAFCRWSQHDLLIRCEGVKQNVIQAGFWVSG